MIYVFDASAALRYLDDEEGASRVETILKDHSFGEARILISAIQWGEIAGIIHSRHAAISVFQALHKLTLLGVNVVDVSADQAVRAAILQRDLALSYADAVAVTLTLKFPSAILVTADFGFKAADDLISIEFLAAKIRTV